MIKNEVKTEVKLEPKNEGPCGRFKVDEDKRLCVAWTTISEDPIVGTEQRANKMWERVEKWYNAPNHADNSKCALRNCAFVMH